MEGIGRGGSGFSHQGTSPNNFSISSVGCSLLVGPLAKSGSVQNIFRSSQIRLWKWCADNGPMGQEDWTTCLMGHLEKLILFLLQLALEVTPKVKVTSTPTGCSHGDCSRELFPHHWHSSTCFAWFPYDSRTFSSTPKVLFPLYMWSTDPGYCLYQETSLTQFFIDLPPLSSANSYLLFKFLFRCHFQVRDPKSRCRARSSAPTRGYILVYIEITYHTLMIV